MGNIIISMRKNMNPDEPDLNSFHVENGISTKEDFEII